MDCIDHWFFLTAASTSSQNRSGFCRVPVSCTSLQVARFCCAIAILIFSILRGRCPSRPLLLQVRSHCSRASGATKLAGCARAEQLLFLAFTSPTFLPRTHALHTFTQSWGDRGRPGSIRFRATTLRLV